MTAMISLAELQRRIDSGALSPEAAITQSLEAIGAHDKPIGAFVCRAETVRAASAGPLRGIAVAIKDIIDTSDLPTEMGSPIYNGWQPRPRGRLSRPSIRRRRSIRATQIIRRADRHRAPQRPSRPE